MLITRRFFLPTLIIGIGVASLITLYILRSCRSEPSQSDPRTLKEVIAIAQKLGLHYRSDQQDGTVHVRLTISESPLTWERANALMLNTHDQSPWKGTIVVFRRNWEGVRTMPNDQFEVWGEFFLYGDPSLIQRLTVITTSKEATGN